MRRDAPISNGELRFRRRVSVAHASVALTSMLIPLLIFQNCSVPAQTTKEEASSLAEKASFAYDASFDQIAYMSCSELTSGVYDKSAYFTFRAGGYRDGGLKVKDNYFESLPPATQRQLTKQESKVEFLTMSPVNTKTQVQFSVRALANFQAIFARQGASAQANDYALVLPELGSKPMTTTLLNQPKGTRLRYMRNGLVAGARFEADLHFGDNPILADSLRASLNGDSMLALTYTDSKNGTATTARAPAAYSQGSSSEQQSVYGRGYVIRFRQPTVSGNLFTNFPNYAIREITELNLENRSDSTGLGTWNCPASLQFRIVEPEDLDLANINCQALPDPAVQSDLLKQIRRTLREEDWFVDLTNRCVVTKKYEGRRCYGNLKRNVGERPNYNTATECSTTDPTKYCVHFVSICQRNAP